MSLGEKNVYHTYLVLRSTPREPLFETETNDSDYYGLQIQLETAYKSRASTMLWMMFSPTTLT